MNKRAVFQPVLYLLSCLGTPFQYLYRSHSFFELGSNESWLILPLFRSLAVWPSWPSYFEVFNTHLELFQQPPVCLPGFLSDFAPLPDHQITRLLFYPSDTPGSGLTSVSGTVCSTAGVSLILGPVCLSGCTSTCGSDGIVLAGCVCVLSCVPLTGFD